MNRLYPALVLLATLIGCTQSGIESSTASDEAADGAWKIARLIKNRNP